MKISENFSREELECKGSGQFKLHDGFIESLQRLRSAYGRAMRINSCCRSKEYNIAVGGHHRSLHVCDDSHHPHDGSMAIDISMKGWSAEERKSLQDLAWSHGWSLGVHHAFLHLDRRIDINLNQAKFYYS